MRHARTFIEAGPGAGKTTVAAERFGVARYCRAAPRGSGVVAVSFTNAAANELRRRISSRWGPAACAGNSRVRTIDSEMVEILNLLLRTGLIEWPGGRTDVEPLDSWAGRSEWAYKHNANWLTYMPKLVGREVRAVREQQGRHGFTKGDLEGLLVDGHCLHEDVRNLVKAVLEDPELRAAVVDHRRQTVSHFIVDEVFDADLLDIDLIAVHCEAEVPVTVVGDRWQALYEFRNAQPQAVEARLNDLGFQRIDVLQSHRFATDEARTLAARVRGQPTPALAESGEHDVDIVLAPWWSQLWVGPAWVLPTSFGPVYDQTDALIALLLDHVTRKHLGEPARSRPEALFTFGLDPRTTDAWPDLFEAVADALTDTTADRAAVALRQLRQSAPAIRAGQVVRARRGEREGAAILQMRLLAARLLQGGPFVCGQSVHQAKGKEWARIGVRLTDADAAALAAGLNINVDRHRTLYVALTRGTHRTGRVQGECLP